MGAAVPGRQRQDADVCQRQPGARVGAGAHSLMLDMVPLARQADLLSADMHAWMCMEACARTAHAISCAMPGSKLYSGLDVPHCAMWMRAFTAVSRKTLLSGVQETVCSLRFAAKVNACETAARGGAKRNVQTGAPDADAAVRRVRRALGASCFPMPELSADRAQVWHKWRF